MHTPRQRRLIAQGLVAEVEHCAGCDILHLHLGAFTLRLKPAVLADLRDTLNCALENLPAAHAAGAADDALRGTCH